MLKIEMFSDYACPFCYVGFSIINKLREERDFEFKHIPVELTPDNSIEGTDLAQHVAEETIVASFERVAGLGEEYGLEYVNKRMTYNTHRLHEAALYASEKGLYFEFSKLAFEYIFTRGENVGLNQVVDEIASQVGLDLEDMNNKINSGFYADAFQEARDLQIKHEVLSVPSFLVNGEKKPTQLKNYQDFIQGLLE